jgi:hypothetical protein
MSVFFRWGIFGILAVAAVLYAYNASKRLSERRAPAPAPVVSQESPEVAVTEADPTAGREEESPPEDVPPMPEACEEERLVAERALKMRRDGEPLDRLLRMDRIAFQSDVKRRERLEAVARRWFEREGRDPDAASLRGEVLRDCRSALAGPATPAP